MNGFRFIVLAKEILQPFCSCHIWQHIRDVIVSDAVLESFFGLKLALTFR